jgi:ATP-dependent Clp protease ATP-binding subunit ClpC
VFERFTDRARRVVVLAQEEARLLGHNYIGTEHILLGLLHEGTGVGARALVTFQVSLAAARTQTLVIVGKTAQAPPEQIPFTPRSKKVLELSLREAMLLKHNYIGTEHILLGLIREGEGVGVQVLKQLGVDLDKLRATVLGLLEGEIEAPAMSEPGETGIRPAVCSSCGTSSPACGALFVVATGALICEHCVESATGTGAQSS